MNKNQSYILRHIVNIGDMLAIPFFGLCVYYFYNLHNRTLLEDILLVFSFLGFVADVLFTYLFFNEKRRVR